MVSLLAWATVLLLACRVQLQVQAAAVFAHFMVGTPPYSLSSVLADRAGHKHGQLYFP